MTLGRKLAAAVERGAALEDELAAVRGAAVEAGGLVTLLQGELDTVKAQACPSRQPNVCTMKQVTPASSSRACPDFECSHINR